MERRHRLPRYRRPVDRARSADPPHRAGSLVGLALGLSGTLIQAVGRNPLADSEVLGINSGAALFVVARSPYSADRHLDVHLVRLRRRAVPCWRGAATAGAGPIGFVGLMVPHAVRRFTGPDWRWVLGYAGPAPLLVWGALLVGTRQLPLAGFP